MFWRKSRAVIAGYHPVHQALILQRGFSAVMSPPEWQALVAGFGRQRSEIRKPAWALPPRAEAVLVPLLQVLTADAGPRSMIEIAVDLRGLQPTEKRGPSQELPVRPPYRSITQWYVYDQWLRARADLRDGSVLRLTVTDVVRNRTVVRRAASGKIKSKVKKRTMQRVSATRALPTGTTARRPASAPPAWVQVRVRPGRHLVIRSQAKLPFATGAEEAYRVFAVIAELFRWQPLDAGDRR